MSKKKQSLNRHDRKEKPAGAQEGRTVAQAAQRQGDSSASAPASESAPHDSGTGPQATAPDSMLATPAPESGTVPLSLRRGISPIGFFFGQSQAARDAAAQGPSASPGMPYPKRQDREPWRTPAARSLAAFAVALAAGLVWFWLNVPAISVADMGFWVMLFWMCLVFTLVKVFLQGSANKPARNPFKRMYLNAKLPTFAMAAIVMVMVAGSLPAMAQAESPDQEAAATQDASASNEAQSADTSSNAPENAQEALLFARQALEADETLSADYEIIPVESLSGEPGSQRWVFAIGQPDAMPSPKTVHQTSPAYVSVDTTTGETAITYYDEPMRYSLSNILLGNTQRVFRAHYPCQLFGNIRLGFDANDNPYWIATTFRHASGLFGESVPTGFIVMDATSGNCERFSLNDAPNWVTI